MPHSAARNATDAPENDGWDALRDAARWWELHRIPYNAALAALFVALVLRTWVRIRPELGWSAVGPLLGLAAIFNLFYCAAYLLDFPLQSVRDRVTLNHWRWAVWTTGMLFALVVECYWYLDEILPPVR
jgi:hypothetical protein